MKVEIFDTPFDPLQAVREHQEAMMAARGSYGAAALFIGTMRDLNEGDSVRRMTLEHYPEMTRKHLEQISREASERWNIIDTLVIHRVGELHPNDPIVLVAAWSAHRGEAFAACRYLIEELKSRAPFWKKEYLEQGERWVEHNTSG